MSRLNEQINRAKELMGLIVEQDKPDIIRDPGVRMEKPTEPIKVTEEEIEELIGLSQNQIEELLLNKSINLYAADTGAKEGELIRVNGEEDVNPFIVHNVEVTTTMPYLGGLPTSTGKDVYVLLTLRNGGGDGHLTLNLMWSCMTQAFKTDGEGYRNFGVRDIVNKEVLDILNKLCYTPGAVNDLNGRLLSNSKIVPDADFAMGDEDTETLA